jgi:hypothetical protein
MKMEDASNQDPKIAQSPSPKYVESEQQKKTRETNFVYHAPKPDQPDRYKGIRDCAGILAEVMNGCCPPSRELSLAMTNLEQAVFWANAAIARNE